MNCAEFEIALADYIDGTLPETERRSLEAHAARCSACAEMMADVTGVVSLLKRLEDPHPPPQLVTHLAYLAPLGRTHAPFESQGLWSRLTAKWLQPVLQPRLVMGMAMTVLSFAMLERCTGIQVQQIHAADLSPVRVWGSVEDKAMRARDQVVKYYENLRLVYEIEAKLKELREQQDAQGGGNLPQSAPATGPKRNQPQAGQPQGGQAQAGQNQAGQTQADKKAGGSPSGGQKP